MKIRITNYTFSPGVANVGTVTFTSYSSITLDSILLITNVTSNVIIYNFADPAFGGTVTGNILTLGYNTTGMNSSDKLIIYYDDPVNIPATDATLTSINNLAQVQFETVNLLKRIADYTSNLKVTDANNRLKVNIDSITSGLSLPNLAAATFIVPNGTSNATTTIFAVQDVWKILDASRLNFATCIREKITFT